MSTIDHAVRPLDVEGILIKLSHVFVVNYFSFVISLRFLEKILTNSFSSLKVVYHTIKVY